MARLDRSTALVLKLGGSLAESRRMDEIVAIVVRATAPLVVVPGGGPFADAVRLAHTEFAMQEAIAHRMALLAMHQMAVWIAARDRRFETVETPAAIVASIEAERIPVWLPFALQQDDPTVPATFDTTSDALAARLAERLGFPAVALAKSCPIPPDVTLEQARDSGITDPVFAEVVTRTGLAWSLYGPADDAKLAARLEVLPAL